MSDKKSRGQHRSGSPAGGRDTVVSRPKKSNALPKSDGNRAERRAAEKSKKKGS